LLCTKKATFIDVYISNSREKLLAIHKFKMFAGAEVLGVMIMGKVDKSIPKP
jgi:hypothetical protein